MIFDNYIESLFERAKHDIDNYIEMLCIGALSEKRNNSKELSIPLIENWLKRRGYVLNNILKRPVWVKDFTCVYVDSNYIEVWHDRIKNNKSVFIDTSFLTGLPITLKYMEKI